MALRTQKTNVPHIFFIDLKNNGVMVECAVMKQDPQGNIYYIQLDGLDQIDRNRITKILRNRNARSFPLWDLMSQVTLGNGMNALNYFHQLVRVATPNGQSLRPGEGKIGVGQVVPGQPITQAPQAQPAATAQVNEGADAGDVALTPAQKAAQTRAANKAKGK